MRIWEVDLILSSRRAFVSGSRSVESLDLSSFSSLWAVECGLMVSRFVELVRGEVGRGSESRRFARIAAKRGRRFCRSDDRRSSER